MADITRNESGRIDPTSSQRDPSKPWNQVRPLSLRTSGAELDPPCCEGGMDENGLVLGKDSAGTLDQMIAKADRRKK
jgi:hypothetical protein